MPVALIVVLAGIGFAEFFVGLWCAVCLGLAYIGGWHGLAQHYRATSPPYGVRHAMATGRIGGVSYNSSLTIHVSAEGFHLAVFPLLKLGAPDLFIPWSTVEKREERHLFGIYTVRLTLGPPTRTMIILSKSVVESVPP
jgi:hypothetical protein